MKQIILCIIMLHFICPLQSQQPQKRELELFKITRAIFHYEQYKWGNELYLDLQGKAHRILDNATLMASLWYRGERVRWKLILLKYDKKKLTSAIYFHEKWGPLNRAHEKILAGDYQLKIDFFFHNQDKIIKTKLKKNIANKTIKNQKLSLYWKSKTIFAREDKKIKNFYSERLRIAHKLYIEGNDCARQALSIPKMIRTGGHNSFMSSRRFNPKKWRAWLNKFREKITQELAIFNKFHKKLFCRRYPTPKANILEFYNLLFRFCSLASIKVYQRNKLQVDARDTRIDSFGIEKLPMVNINLKRLLKEAARSLQLGIFK